MKRSSEQELTDLAKRVIDRMNELGVSQAEVVRRGRFNRAFVSDLVLGRKTDMRDQNYSRLAMALLTTPKYLRTGEPPTSEELALLGAEGRVPVSSDNPQWTEKAWEKADEVIGAIDFGALPRIDKIAAARRPSEWGNAIAIPLFRSEGRYDGAAVIRNPAAEMIRGPHSGSASGWYAIAVSDSNMSPRYEAGEFVYAMQGTKVRPRDFVVVRVAGRVGRNRVQLGYVRQLLRRTAEEVVVRQLSPNIETAFRNSALIDIDRIVVAGEIVGEEIL